jgi:hypothetical protein
MFGDPGEEYGDKLVYQALDKLSDDFIVYSQPKLVHRREVAYPDYVIIYRPWGVFVIEVKDWVSIIDRDRKNAKVHRIKTGKEEWDTSPVEQARNACFVLVKMLKADRDLRNHAGKLDFAYAYGGALPHLPTPTITWLENAWGENTLLGRDDLSEERLQKRLEQIPVPFRVKLTERQVQSIRAILDARNKVIDKNTGGFLGVYDEPQEQIIKEPLEIKSGESDDSKGAEQMDFGIDQKPSIEKRAKILRTDLPENVAKIVSKTGVRLVRGFAGTGKTDVLILRAHHLFEKYPHIRILVTTFNRPVFEQRLVPELRDVGSRVDVSTFDTLCSTIYKAKHGQWVKPQSTEGIIAKLVEEHPQIDEIGRKFLSDEFIWMKETERTERQKYVDSVRDGRGSFSKRVFSKRQKHQIFDLFEAYQERLADIPAHDWVDLHEKVARYLKEGIKPDKKFHAILIDEAQHFAPTWMTILYYFLEPDGNIFVCDDPSQSVYRYFSWRQKGVDVVGRTKWLRVPYRNTRQIFQAAYSLISANPTAKELLSENGSEIVPEIEEDSMRDGPRPQVLCFSNIKQEREFIVREIEKLIQEKGLLPVEIGILHEKKHVLDSIRNDIPKNVQLQNMKRQTGLEYKAVFIPQVHQNIDRDIEASWEEDQARQQIMFYMAITRARNYVYLSYTQKWPKVLEPLRPFVRWVDQ